MVPVLIELGPVSIYTFGALMALAFLVSGSIVAVELERKGMDPEHAWSILFWAALGGLVGARLFVVFDDWRGFLEHPVSILLSGSGFVWYGGLLGGVLSVTLYLRSAGLAWLPVVDVLAPGLAIGHAIGRIGCQVAGDGDWGKPTSLPWGMTYPRAVIGWTEWARSVGLPPTVRVHPAPVYESLAYSAIFLVLWQLRRRALPAGSLFWAYLALSSVARFAVEAVRIEPVVATGLTQAQWIAIVLFIVGTAMLVSRRMEPEAP
ncbi:MAG: phosphatidylglycerol---prolipoprotein diacylglyceryl transferase [Candidatus Binatota bacterium]|jgi:phosphatidylglycerol:prolipoprotein diacylglycerol transferase|nr:phosphatidylglycerol---prolipoprotein diacylglyceryl transferase [Candidatus Binatota bacterium]